MNKNILQIEKKLNISIKNKSLFLEALTHKSSNKSFNNEKLEFLGDRVIGLALSRKLFDLYPNESEGALDKRFAILVNKKTCATIFWSLGIKNLVVLGDSKKTLEKEDEKILSDACESLIAAIYLENGFIFTEKLIVKLWKKELDKSNITIVDPKSKLQEHSLKLFNKLPFYKLESLKGPRHDPIFSVSVKIRYSKKFTGVGSSKKNAEQDAAKKLLSNINKN